MLRRIAFSLTVGIALAVDLLVAGYFRATSNAFGIPLPHVFGELVAAFLFASVILGIPARLLGKRTLGTVVLATAIACCSVAAAELWCHADEQAFLREAQRSAVYAETKWYARARSEPFGNAGLVMIDGKPGAHD